MTRRIEPGPGQESVWDYPRPPAIEPVEQRIRVVFNGETIADTSEAHRILETSHPPTYYLPPGDVELDVLHRHGRTSMCEYKGQAIYFDVTVGDQTAHQAAWAYPSPRPGYAELKDHISFYASKMDACFVGEQEARAQEGDFYGGWITDSVVGPFKGGAGTIGW